MSTSRQDIEVRKAYAVLTKQRMERRMEETSDKERMSLSLKNLIQFCDDTIILCNTILSWPKCPAGGMFGRDCHELDDCGGVCSMTEICDSVSILGNSIIITNKNKEPYTPKCFGRFTKKNLHCECCPFIVECKEIKNAG